jgi:hypothetical protein
MIRLTLMVITLLLVMKPAHALTEMRCSLVGSLAGHIIDMRGERKAATRIAKMKPSQFSPNFINLDIYPGLVPYIVERSLAHDVPGRKKDRRHIKKYFSKSIERGCIRVALEKASG